MSQRAEKYARNMERRVDKLEEQTAKVMQDMEEVEKRVAGMERAMSACQVVISGAESRRQSETDGEVWRRQVVMVIAVVLAVVALIAAIKIMGGSEAEAVEPEQTAAVSNTAEPVPVIAISTDGNIAFPGQDRAADNQQDQDKAAEALEAQGYFSAAVPMCCEYQDYMRTYCRDYGCPYPLALAVAEVESNFDMETVGAVGEAGIMQLNPGPNGAYHAELEAATGLDPTTPEGNIAGGCYLLGKYLAEYEDLTMAAMAYSMGQTGAQRAREAGRSSTTYTDAVLEAMAQWECEVNAWAGE